MTAYRPARDSVRLRNAVVTAVTGSLVDLSVGDGTATGVPVHGTVPKVGDRVLVAEQGGSLLVLGTGMTQAGVLQGTLTFAAGWANVPHIPVPQAPAGTVWSPTATAHDTHNGRVWVVTVIGISATVVALRVYNLRDAAYTGSQPMIVHWRASPVPWALATTDGGGSDG